MTLPRWVVGAANHRSHPRDSASRPLSSQLREGPLGHGLSRRHTAVYPSRVGGHRGRQIDDGSQAPAVLRHAGRRRRACSGPVPRGRRTRSPQSGERFEGRDAFTEWRSQYPAEVAFEVLRVTIRDDLAVVELSASYDGGTTTYGVGLLEFRGDFISRERIYIGEGWEPPDWRAPWRSAAAGRKPGMVNPPVFPAHLNSPVGGRTECLWIADWPWSSSRG